MPPRPGVRDGDLRPLRGELRGEPRRFDRRRRLGELGCAASSDARSRSGTAWPRDALRRGLRKAIPPSSSPESSSPSLWRALSDRRRDAMAVVRACCGRLNCWTCNGLGDGCQWPTTTSGHLCNKHAQAAKKAAMEPRTGKNWLSSASRGTQLERKPSRQGSNRQ